MRAINFENLQTNTRSHQYRLLEAFKIAGDFGCTSTEAASLTGLMKPGTCYWKRCNELRSKGYIVQTGESRLSTITNRPQMVSVITEEGMAALNAGSYRKRKSRD
jgi:hypothetical protein